MMVTIIPVAINMAAEATYRLEPKRRSINDFSERVHTPIANTTTPPIWLQRQIKLKLRKSCLIHFLINYHKLTIITYN